jgi:hypothetical protein
MRKAEAGATSNGGDDAQSQSPSGIFAHGIEPDELQRQEDEAEDAEYDDDTSNSAELQRAPDAPPDDDEEKKLAFSAGFGGGCSSCGAQRKEEEPEPTTPDPVDEGSLSGAAQREPDEADDEEALNQASVQAKLVVGKVDDPQDREADEVAERVMRIHDADVMSSHKDDAILRRTRHEQDPLDEEEPDPDAARSPNARLRVALPDPTPRRRLRSVVLGGQPLSPELTGELATLRRSGGNPLPRIAVSSFFDLSRVSQVRHNV